MTTRWVPNLRVMFRGTALWIILVIALNCGLTWHFERRLRAIETTLEPYQGLEWHDRVLNDLEAIKAAVDPELGWRALVIAQLSAARACACGCRP